MSSSILLKNIWTGGKQITKSNPHRVIEDGQHVSSTHINGYGPAPGKREGYAFQSSALKHHDGLEAHGSAHMVPVHKGASGHLAAGAIAHKSDSCGSTSGSQFIGNTKHSAFFGSDLDKHISGVVNQNFSSISAAYARGGSHDSCEEIVPRDQHGHVTGHYQKGAELYKDRAQGAKRSQPPAQPRVKVQPQPRAQAPPRRAVAQAPPRVMPAQAMAPPRRMAAPVAAPPRRMAAPVAAPPRRMAAPMAKQAPPRRVSVPERFTRQPARQQRTTEKFTAPSPTMARMGRLSEPMAHTVKPERFNNRCSV